MAKSNVSSGTFSILATSPDSKLIGVAVASGSPSVGNRVPHAKPGVGVVATQAYTNIEYGVKGLELLEKGKSPKDVLAQLLNEDSENDKRQVAIIDFKGRKAFFTGENVPDYHAEAIGEDYIVIGNLLSCTAVVASMAEQFENVRGNLAYRMVKALMAGSKCGGDRRGEASAALIVVGAKRVEVEAAVDLHKNPIGELSKMLKSR